jgi:hypothetical protein
VRALFFLCVHVSRSNYLVKIPNPPSDNIPTLLRTKPSLLTIILCLFQEYHLYSNSFRYIALTTFFFPWLRIIAQAKRCVARVLYRPQPLLKSKRSPTTQDGSIVKGFFKSNVSMPSTVLKCCDLMNYKLQPCILMLPTEALENICDLVDELDDLRTLTHVSRLFASIACHVYAARLKIDVTSPSRFVRIQGESFRALTTWRRSRLFPCLHDKYLSCDINDQDPELANMEIKLLRRFLSTTFVGRPFIAVHINSADALSPPAILQFIQLVDSIGCQTVSISSGLTNPEWFHSSLTSGPSSLKLGIISLSNLRSLNIDNQYFSPRHWSSLLRHLTGPNLQTISIRGQPTIHTLSEFISRHSNISRLRFQPRFTTHNRCMKLVEVPAKVRMMTQLSEIDGPPCHVRALLKCLWPTSAALTIKMGYDRAMTYPQYVRAVLHAVSLCSKSHVHLEIHLLSCYDLVLDQKGIVSITSVTLPEVASLEISFPSMSERCLLVCINVYIP